jgi:hypothetical protein
MDRDFFAGLNLENNRREAESTEKWAAEIRTLDPTLNEHQGYYPAELDMKKCASCGDYFDETYEHNDEYYCFKCLDGILEYDESNLMEYELKTA